MDKDRYFPEGPFTSDPALSGSKRKLHFIWTCSDYVYHEHRWQFTAWLCGRWQRMNGIPKADNQEG